MNVAARSMTGFSEARAEDGEFAVQVGIRSVNHRSLDIKLRSPQEAARLGMRIRKAIRQRVRRGSLHVTIEVDFPPASAARVDRALILARVDAMRQIADICGVPAQPDPHALASLPGAVLHERAEIPQEKLESLVAAGLDRALALLDRARAEEGLGLVKDIGGHADAIASELDGLSESVQAAVKAGHERQRQRLSDLVGTAAIDPQRLAHEVAVLASRSDASEELQRLRSHLAGLRRCLESDSAVGKRIDFLAQEMNREANTLLSKAQPLGASALSITEAGIRVRAAIEKIREQAMNLE